MKSEHHLDDDALSSIAVCEFVDFPRGTGTTVGASHLKRDCSGHGASQFMTQQQLKSRTVNDQSDKMKNDDWSIQRTAPSAVFLTVPLHSTAVLQLPPHRPYSSGNLQDGGALHTPTLLEGSQPKFQAGERKTASWDSSPTQLLGLLESFG